MKTEVSNREKAQSQREPLIGNWKLINVKTVSQSNYPGEKIFAELPENKRIGGVDVDVIKSVRFDYQKFSFQLPDNKVDFGYSVDSNEINSSSGDTLFKLKFHVQGDSLVIESLNFRNVLNVLTFKRES